MELSEEEESFAALGGDEETTLSTLSFPPSNLANYSRKEKSSSISPRTLQFIRMHYPAVPLDDWNDWRWQIRNSITAIDELRQLIPLREDEIHVLSTERDCLPFRITPYHASLVHPEDSHDPLRRILIPDVREFNRSAGEAEDPLNEDEMSPVPGIVHRYPDRVLFLTTDFCASNCRYCTRSRMVGRDEHCFTPKNWELAFDYIRSHTEIRDVLLSGGDPLTLTDETLEYLLSKVREIPHVEIIRIGTRIPVVLPQRITPKLMRIFRKHHPLWMNIHFSHPRELTQETSIALNRLADTGIPLGSQTVLLKGINDDADILRELFLGLVKNRVRPYYLYQCDPILGSEHFRTPVDTGIEIISKLRGYNSGLAIPQYVIDAPGGGGKIPLQPDFLIDKGGGMVRLRNFKGGVSYYPDTSAPDT
ncbi:MAG: hypothetical protein A2Y33_09535 [Spirochaetes bacterium GWF1_51_8]|nr:MAG: hypothetical protein A2Y33_09535 [Spirochaetes bacterium GWF1_51_8]